MGILVIATVVLVSLGLHRWMLPLSVTFAISVALLFSQPVLGNIFALDDFLWIATSVRLFLFMIELLSMFLVNLLGGRKSYLVELLSLMFFAALLDRPEVISGFFELLSSSKIIQTPVEFVQCFFGIAFSSALEILMPLFAGLFVLYLSLVLASVFSSRELLTLFRPMTALYIILWLFVSFSSIVTGLLQIYQGIL